MKSPDLPVVEFKLDGRTVQALQGETVLQAAERVGVEIPRSRATSGMTVAVMPDLIRHPRR